MKFYKLTSVFSSGKYMGKTLEEILETNPQYVDYLIRKEENFCISADVVEKIQDLYPEFQLSKRASEILLKKFSAFMSSLSVFQNYVEDEIIIELDFDRFNGDFDDIYDDAEEGDHWGNINIEGCGLGFSCDECSNYGCPSHPFN